MEDLSKRSHLLNRNGHYYLRVRVPIDLAQQYHPQVEIKRSLKTKDLKEAKLRLSIELLKVEEEFEKKRRQLLANERRQSIAITQISKTDIERAVIVWHRKRSITLAQEDELDRVSHSPTEKTEIIHTLAEELHAMSVAPEEVYASSIYMSSKQVLEASAIPLEALDKELKTYLIKLVRAACIEQKYDSLERFGVFHQRVPSVFFSNSTLAIANSEPQQPDEINLDDLLNKFRKAKQSDGLTEKSLAGYKLTFDFALELFGKDKPIKSILSSDCREFRDKLALLPSNAKKKFPHLSLMQAIEKRAKGTVEALSVTSVNGHMKNLSAIFNFAVKERLLEINPATHVPPLKTKRHSPPKRVPFSSDELKQLLSTPLYTGCKDDEHGYNISGTNKPRRHRFWVPLIALYTGMRLNEICQLFADDIECVDGVDVIHIRIDENETKTLKTAHSERAIPIHKKLIDIGFLDYVKKIRTQKEKQLFPDLPISSRESLSDNFSKWFNRFLTASNLKRTGLCFHSFRHTFRDECRLHDINKEIAASLGGWKNSDDVMDKYGKGYELKILQREINKIHKNLILTL